MQFGKFASFSDFLESYKAAQQTARQGELAAMPSIADKVARVRQPRDVVEVQTLVDNYIGPENGHQQMYVKITTIMVAVDPNGDGLEAAKDNGSQVFVAIRYGDSEGLAQPIPGVGNGSDLHMKGQWIPAAQAYAHGGEKTDVLHFTHHPIGFVCTDQDCYQ
jgi:endonuclease G